eukprot:5399222-Amphidinium_carterae.1
MLVDGCGVQHSLRVGAVGVCAVWSCCSALRRGAHIQCVCVCVSKSDRPQNRRLLESSAHSLTPCLPRPVQVVIPHI